MRYRTIVADPPWRYQKDNGMAIRTAEGHYQTMSPAEVAGLPLGDLAADDAHLYVWVTNPVLTRQRWETIGGGPDVMDMVRGWGFEPKTLLTWHKGGGGMGWYFRGDTEHVVFASRGDAGIAAELRVSNLFASPRAGHSSKPDAFLDMVEAVSPGPYLEMFARRARFGWDYWGDESLGTIELSTVEEVTPTTYASRVPK